MHTDRGCRALSDDGGQVALTRIAHAQRTVDEHLGLDAGLLGVICSISSRVHSRLSTTRESRCRAPALLRRACGWSSAWRREGREIRCVCVDEPRQPQILHDERVRASLRTGILRPRVRPQLAIACTRMFSVMLVFTFRARQ